MEPCSRLCYQALRDGAASVHGRPNHFHHAVSYVPSYSLVGADEATKTKMCL